jgi:cytoskeletal protein RodZ
MDIFENLIEELKEENLLEETVIETSRSEKQRNEDQEPSDHDESFSMYETVDAESPEELSDEDESFPVDSTYEAEDSDSEEPVSESDVEAPAIFEADETADENVEAVEAAEAFEETVDENASIKSESADAEELKLPKPPVNGVEFYRQRAMKEVSGLQMVEHVLSGIERDQMKVLPKPYDDLEANKILHEFMRVSNDLNSPEHAQAEFKLMQETESWYSALSHRDKSVSVTHLRRFCETTRPVLSSQALISLARFYRNSPYSETVRSKFDLIITRLFAKEIGDKVRKMVFEREEMIKHLTMLYAEWASVPLYAANEDDSEILLMTLKFEDFMSEADSADSFDELIKNDFFNRLRIFKESTNDNFFAPLVTATAIECNVRVGNRYVELLRIEHEKADSEMLRDKYGFLHDQSISEAASMSLHLVDLLEQKSDEDDEAATPRNEQTEFEITENAKPAETVSKSVKKESKKKKRGLFSVNRWLLLATIFVILINAGLYIWSKKYGVEEANVVKNVKSVNLENSMLKDVIKEGRIAKETFFGVVQPSWSGLTKERKEEVLKKVYSAGDDKGFRKVHLLDSRGKTVGYADAEKVDVY